MNTDYEKRAISPSMREFVKRLEKVGVDARQDRWSAGIPHHYKSEVLVNDLANLDFIYFDDSQGLKIGGDGDNGETLMYLLDILFELYEKESKVFDG